MTDGMTVWDIGANVGFFAFPAASRAGRAGFVLAVEPDLDLVALLQRSRRRVDPARSAPVHILPAAVLDGRTRFARLAIAVRARSSNAVVGHGNSQMGGVRETRVVPAFTLDELLEYGQPPGFVKVDIEGAEARAVAGARRLLDQVRPILLLEVSPGENAEQVGRILRESRYVMFDAEVAPEVRRELAMPAWNTLALPGTAGRCA